MLRRRPPLVACALVAALSVDVAPARSQSTPPPAAPPATPSAAPSTPATRVTGSPIGLGYLRALGPRAADMLAPSSGLVGALVAVPPGSRAEDFGLDAVAPGIGRLRASPQRVEAFGAAHPGLHMEIAPPLHPLLDRAGLWVRSFDARRQLGADGTGVYVGVADTGLDVTNPEMRDDNGKSRVAWMLDLSLLPLGVYPDLEDKFGLKDDTGKLTAGAVLSKDMIDVLLSDYDKGNCVEAKGKKCAPSDEVGHGTHVTGIAAGRGDRGLYPGIAPQADMVIVRVATGTSEGIENDNLVRAVQFMFDRADTDKKPLVANVSLGSDFGPHDGTFLWEKSIAASVGPDKPGHAIVAAAGNSGSFLETPIHQSVHVSRGARMRVPITTGGADSGSVQVWVTLRAGADLNMGLEGPDGEWIPPIAQGIQSGKNTSDYNAGIIFGYAGDPTQIPEGSNSGVVLWQGKWPSGTYNITLEGSGMAELYLQGLGDATLGGDRGAYFTNGIREGTINLPATHPSIIGVGCTINRPSWTSIAHADVEYRVPLLDQAGGLGAPSTDAQGNPLPTLRELSDGEVCWFSSAGPTATGVPKPEIAAPGGFVISALSRNAKPGTAGSIFSSSNCPLTDKGKKDDRCLQIDATHGVAVGTSMSSPIVAGVVALLLQKDPTLTQDKIVALLQAGAHRFRGAAPFDDQAGPGEVDAMGALDALDRMKDPALYLPSANQSWLTLSTDYVPADGSTEVTAIVELRNDEASQRADFFDPTRLLPVLLVDGKPVDPQPTLTRRGPGLWVFGYRPEPGLGGSSATFGATFDGEPIVPFRTVPIAADGWNASYPSHAMGSSCSLHGTSAIDPAFGASALGAAAVLLSSRRRARRERRERARAR